MKKSDRTGSSALTPTNKLSRHRWNISAAQDGESPPELWVGETVRKSNFVKPHSVQQLGASQLGPDQGDVEGDGVGGGGGGGGVPHVTEPRSVLGQEAVDKLDPGPPELLDEAVNLELDLEGRGVPLDPGGAGGEGSPDGGCSSEGLVTFHSNK